MSCSNGLCEKQSLGGVRRELPTEHHGATVRDPQEVDLGILQLGKGGLGDTGSRGWGREIRDVGSRGRDLEDTGGKRSAVLERWQGRLQKPGKQKAGPKCGLTGGLPLGGLGQGEEPNDL